MSEELESFSFKAISPQSTLIHSDSVSFLKVPGFNGEVGILPNHSPALINLDAGEILLQVGTQTDWYFISEGLLEITPDSVTLLTPYIEKGSEIDENRANQSLDRAKRRLENPAESIDINRAKQSMHRATNRLKLHARLHTKSI